MTSEEMKELNLTPIEDFISEDFGAEGTLTRMEFDADTDAFILGKRLKEERQRLGLHRSSLRIRLEQRKAIYHVSRTDIQTYNSQHS